MRKTMVIGLAIVLVAAATPVAAHTEAKDDACTGNTDPCTPQGNHEACKGTRDWFDQDGGSSLSMLGLHIAEDPQEVGAYLHLPPHSDESADPEGPAGLIQMPGVLWLETNGFSSLQKADWYCESVEHGSDEMLQHADQVIL